MKTSSIKDYFYKCITLTSSVMDDEMKLTWKEREFLAECCYFNYNGGNLNSFKDLSEYMLSIRFFSNKEDCSLYKSKIRKSKWILSRRNLFILPPDLDIKKGEEHKMKFNINLTYEPKEDMNVD